MWTKHKLSLLTILVAFGLVGVLGLVLHLALGGPATPSRDRVTALFVVLVGGGATFAVVLRVVLGRLFRSQADRLRAERLYRAFVEQTSDGVLLAEAVDLSVLEVNRAARVLLGVRRANVVGLPLSALLPPDKIPLGDDLRGLHADGALALGELRVTDEEGHVRQAELRASLISHDARPVLCFLIRDITDRREAEERIRFYAYHDPLTELPNRRLFEDRLEVAIARARRAGEMVGVLFVDLDNLKGVNDTHGHEAGDSLIKAFSRRLCSAVRAEDTVARAGGDEFLVLLAGLTQPPDAIVVANRLLESLRQPHQLGEHTHRSSASIGIALYPYDGADVPALVRNADLAMYHAKERGKDRWRLYDRSMNQRLENLVEMRARLETALEREEFVVHYQPQVDARSGALVGFEALVRWQPPGEPIVLPGEFIPVAEQTGLMARLGEWVLRSVCAQLRAWRHEGLEPPRVAVNVSGRQFAQQDLVALTARVLEEYGLSPELLELEITESVAMDSPESARRVLESLTAIGVSTALDDFGTGYSSLAWLRLLPVARIKIDRSFLADLHQSADSRSVVRSMVDLARGLGLQSVAEGVESILDCTLLAEFGCDVLQGYALSRPLPVVRATQLLQSGESLLERARRRSVPSEPEFEAPGGPKQNNEDRVA